MSNDLTVSINRLGVSEVKTPKPATASSRIDEDIPEAERQKMRQTAEAFEGVFVAQMLKHAGFDKAFGQEAEAFSQFLLNKVGDDIAEGMDLGFAEKAYQQMVSRYVGAKDVAE